MSVPPIDTSQTTQLQNQMDTKCCDDLTLEKQPLESGKDPIQDINPQTNDPNALLAQMDAMFMKHQAITMAANMKQNEHKTRMSVINASKV